MKIDKVSPVVSINNDIETNSQVVNAEQNVSQQQATNNGFINNGICTNPPRINNFGGHNNLLVGNVPDMPPGQLAMSQSVMSLETSSMFSENEQIRIA